jgi:S1-C subfamily serine protease
MMRENDSEPDGWQPAEYASPWAPDPSQQGPSQQGPSEQGASEQGPNEPEQPRFEQPGPDTPSRLEPPDHQPPGHEQQAFGVPPDWGNWVPAQGYQPPPPPGRARRLLIYATVAIVAAGLGAGATVAFNQNSAAPSTGVSAREIPAQHDNAVGSGAAGELSQALVEKKVDPGLVDITATLKYNSETAQGTGMILSSGGLVLTNNHVIDNSTSVSASLVDGNHTYQAKVVGYDSTDDVALLQLEGASGLPVVTFGNSDQVAIGTPVLALGNAEGRGGATPAQGIINALDRSINASDDGSGTVENLHDMEQTSAQIEQGDSGGALANNAGQVIGMITAANTSSDQAGGTIGFAIPINTARAIALEIAGGEASTNVYIGYPGFLGVVVATSNSSVPRTEASDEQQYLAQHTGDSSIGGSSIGGGLSNGGNNGGCILNSTYVTAPTVVAPVSTGALIVDSFCGTAANKAGLVPGDVITSVDGHAVTTPNSLSGVMPKFHPGDVVPVSWVTTSGAKHSADLRLGPGPVR